MNKTRLNRQSTIDDRQSTVWHSDSTIGYCLLAFGYLRPASVLRLLAALRPATVGTFVVALVFTALSLSAATNPPPLVSLGNDGRLVYDPDERGNRVPDFSTCGYAHGNRRIPNAPVRVVVEAKPGDSTARIQKALDYVAGLPSDTNGLRGAVLLLKGRHEITGGLHITNSGVVLRGQRTDSDGTLLIATGLDRRTMVR